MHILPKLYIIFPVFFILIIEDIHTQNVSTFAEYGTTIHTGNILHVANSNNTGYHQLKTIHISGELHFIIKTSIHGN